MALDDAHRSRRPPDPHHQDRWCDGPPGTELFLESAEPTFDELSLADLLERFPEGSYRFVGRDLDGNHLVGAAPRAGTEYEWEVLAIEESGNQTLSSSSFTTADR